jgi:bifunctional enzyme CysN/CysC
MGDVYAQDCSTAAAPFKELLCVVACGDLDGGKTTLVSRLLHDTRSLYEAFPASAREAERPRRRASVASGRRPVDRVAAAYAQGLSTEVSYRCFSTPARQFILAEVPDDLACTRNAVVGASTASAALVVVDVHQGLTTQARRHALILALLGIRQVAVVVNKMDLAGYAQPAFEACAAEVRQFAHALGLHGAACIPASVLLGDNVLAPSAAMPWYPGPTLRTWLEGIDLDADAPAPRPAHASARHAEPAGGVQAADRIEATVMWFDEAPLLRGRTYWLKSGARTVAATVTRVVHRIDIDTLDRTTATRLARNEAGVCELALDPPLVIEPDPHGTGQASFALIDRGTRSAAAAGRLRRPLRDAAQAAWHTGTVDKAARAARKSQTPCVVWFTGLPAAGKSTIADLVEQRLFRRGYHTCLLDGANLRHGLNKDLGFSDADCAENTRRVGEVARLMVEAGLIVLVALVSPFRAERRMARSLVDAGEFFEVHVDAPLAVAERRDSRGLYRKARNSPARQPASIDSAYEPPEQPDLHIDTTQLSAEQAADLVMDRLVDAGVI